MGTKEKCAAGLLLIGTYARFQRTPPGTSVISTPWAFSSSRIRSPRRSFWPSCVGPGPDQGLHLGILAAVLADHGEAAGGGSRRLGLAQGRRLLRQLQAQHLVEAVQSRQLGASVVLAFSTS